MVTFNSLNEVGHFIAGGVLTIGNFDGVHRGHQALIKKVCELNNDRPGALLTFTPHPREFFKAQPFFYLTRNPEKCALCHKLGLDAVIIHPLSQSFLALSPEQFVFAVLHKQLNVSDVVVGEDFAFGNKAQGTVADLKRLAKPVNIKVHIVPHVIVDGKRCSSSVIRSSLSEGNLEAARLMLGRPYSILGTVVKDQGRGARLGFATANLKRDTIFLKRGVYASITRVWQDDGYKDYLSATNIGVRPSVTDEHEITIETHCLDVHLDVYNAQIEIFFIDYLRGEQKFSVLKELQEQVQRDFQAVRQLSLLHPLRYDVAG